MSNAAYPREAAEAAGWRHSREHGGWVHESERDPGGPDGLLVLHTPDDACRLHGIAFRPHPTAEEALGTVRF